MNELFKLSGVPVVFCSEFRVKPEERDENLFYYNMRHPDDDWSIPWSVEKGVLVNFFGTIATTEPIEFLEFNNSDNRKEIELTEEEQELIWQNL